MDTASAKSSTVDLSIIINEIRFTLIKKTEYNERYKNVVQISSLLLETEEEEEGEVQEETIFWVYQSNSELGLWRFCLQNTDTNGIDRFYKGTDYVQSTLIHLELQNFININLQNIPTVVMDISEKNKECFCDNLTTNSNPHCSTKQFVETINDEHRRITHERPFSELNDLDRDGFLGCGSVPRGTPQHEFDEYMSYFSKELEAEFNYEPENQLYEYHFNFENIIDINGHIYSIKLTRKIDESMDTHEVILYFLIVNLKKINNIRVVSKYSHNVATICGKPYHIFPFLLTTSAAYINYLGLYSNYIACGAYICKLFDYAEDEYTQCTVEEIHNNRCTDIYSYIGHRYDNLFPLNIVLANLNKKCPIPSASTRTETTRTASSRSTIETPRIATIFAMSPKFTTEDDSDQEPSGGKRNKKQRKTKKNKIRKTKKLKYTRKTKRNKFKNTKKK